MNAAGCGAPSWGAKSEAFFLNVVAWILPTQKFQFTPTPPVTDAVSREFTVFVGNTGPIEITDASSREFSLFVGNTQPIQITDANSREFSLYVNAPDLVVSQLTAPHYALAGSTASVSWTVSNDGQAAAGGSWEDRVYLTTSPAFSEGAPVIGSFPFSGSLEPGESYARTESLPMPETLGDYWIHVRTNATGELPKGGAEENNLATAPNETSVVDEELPDLVVVNLTPPTGFSAGESIEVAWTIRNIGLTDAVGPWEETLYGSLDAGGAQSIELSTFVYAGTLAPGASVVRVETVMVPAEVPPGEYFARVCVDSGGVIDELNTDNNCLAEPVCVDCVYPDLLVQAVVGPPVAEDGSEIEISWMVTNQGDGPAEGLWIDRLYLSVSTEFDSADIVLGSVSVPGPIPAGEGYTIAQTFTLPLGVSGTFHLGVFTDAENDLSEPGGEGNNWLASVDPIEITLAERPDLIVLNGTAPSEAYTGAPLPITFEVQNIGAAEAVGPWIDRVELHPEPKGSGEIVLLGEVPFAGTLAPGESTLRDLLAVAPEAEGEYRLVITTDALGAVYEGIKGDANNTFIGPRLLPVVDEPFPDLQVDIVAGPASAVYGSAIEVTWTVTNHGDLPAEGPWSDQISLAANASGMPSVPLGTFTYRGTLAPGASVQRTESVTLPPIALGERWLMVETNVNGDVPEGPYALNNTRVSNDPIDLLGPDLAVTTISLPSSALFGDLITLTWIVTNEGSAAAQGTWQDRVYLSPTPVISGASVLLDSQTIVGESPFAPGATYQRIASVTLPLTQQSVAGEQYIIVVTDFLNAVPELNVANNTLAEPIDLTLPPLPNLVVSAISAPQEGAPGSATEVEWTVTNTGTAPAEGPWLNSILASSDNMAGNDLLLATRIIEGSLGVGESAVLTATVVVPNFLNNEYWLVACADSGGNVVEEDPSDNCLVSQTSASIWRPDLVVTSVAAPTSAMGDEVVVIEWTVENEGQTVANPLWIDRVSLIPVDAKGEPTGAPLHLGTTFRQSPLLAGQFYTASLNITIPGTIHDGEYLVSVATDITNTVIESGDPANNVFAAKHQTLITQPDRPNLVVETIAVLADGLIGAPATVEYIVRNIGKAPASGSWTDRVSAIEEETGQSFVLANVFVSDTLAPGEAYTQSLDVAYPTAPGTYRLRVETDRTNAINEGLDGGEDDNVTDADTTFLVDTYIVTVNSTLSEAVSPMPNLLFGTATLASDGTPIPDAAVSVAVSVQGTTRLLSAQSDENGNFETTFQPLNNEAGQYALRAGPPQNIAPSVQDTFVLYGMRTQPVTRSAIVYPNVAQVTGTIQIINNGDVPISGLQATAEAPGAPRGLEVQVSVSGSALPPHGSVTLSYAIDATGEDFGLYPVQIQISSDQGATAAATLNVSIQPPQASLKATPAALTASMVVPADARTSTQTIVEFAVMNEGAGVAENVQVLIPNEPWMSLATNPSIGMLVPGQSRTVTLLLSPAASLPLGPYTGTIVVSSASGSRVIPYTFTAASSQTGDLRVKATDEGTYWQEPDFPPVANAMVTVRDYLTDAVVCSGISDASGEVLCTDLPVAYYRITAMEPSHGGFETVILLGGGTTTFVEAFMPENVVSYEWVVVPVDFDDEYTITIETIFETNVPAPVITIDPPLLDLNNHIGGISQVDFKITNHGLIKADSMTLNIVSNSRFQLTPLVNEFGDLGAGQSVVVPVKIEDVFEPGGAIACGPIPFGVNWTLTCGIPVPYSVTIPVVQPQQDCPGGGPIGGSGAGGGSPGGSGGSPNPVSNPPVIHLPVLCGSCEPGNFNSEGECFDFDLKAVKEKVKSFAEWLTSYQGSFEGEDDDIKLELCWETCCSESGTKGRRGRIKYVGPVKLDVPNVGDIVEYIVDVVDFNVDEWIPLATISGELKVKLIFDGSIDSEMEIEATTSCSAILPLPEDLRILYRGNSQASFGVQEVTFTGTLNVVGMSPIQLGVSNMHAGAFTGLQGEVEWSASKGWDGSICFSGLWLQFGLTVHAPLFGSHTFCGRTYLLCPRGLPSADEACPWPTSCPIVTWSGTTSCSFGPPTNMLSGANEDAAEGYQLLELLSDEVLAVIEEGWPYLQQLSDLEYQDQEGICAQVTVQLNQDIVISRGAFEATLRLDNNSLESPLEAILIEPQIIDLTGNSANHLFEIFDPELSGFAAVDGTGSLLPGTSGLAKWLIVPSHAAAPETDTYYFVRGTLQYALDGELRTIPLFPVPITVVPNAQLDLRYYLETLVFADDPFTPDVIEPSVPFSLGLMVLNRGAGPANNFRITTAQPEIIRNDLGLLIDFQLIGQQIGTEEVSPTLTANLGDIGPDDSRVVRWLMTSTLQGEFIEYNATFVNNNGLGEPGLSLIENLDIYPITSVVRADQPFDDGLPDFLVYDPDALVSLPHELHLSDGTIVPVASITDASVSGTPREPKYVSQVMTELPEDWAYIRVEDPSDGALVLSSVVRSDGRVIDLEWNAWQTRAILNPPSNAQPAYLHIFDRAPQGEAGPYTYTLTFVDAEPPAVSADSWVVLSPHGALGELPLPVPASNRIVDSRGGGISAVRVDFSGTVNPSTFRRESVVLRGRTLGDEPVDLSTNRVLTTLTQGGTVGRIIFQPPLPTGRYCLELVGVEDASGQAIAGRTQIHLTSLTGDVNGDGRVTGEDIIFINELIGTDPIDPGNPLHVRCDLDRDGRITSADLVIVGQSDGNDLRGVSDPCLDVPAFPVDSLLADAVLEGASSSPDTPSVGSSAGQPMLGAASDDRPSRVPHPTIVAGEQYVLSGSDGDDIVLVQVDRAGITEFVVEHACDQAWTELYVRRIEDLHAEAPLVSGARWDAVSAVAGKPVQRVLIRAESPGIYAVMASGWTPSDCRGQLSLRTGDVPFGIDRISAERVGAGPVTFDLEGAYPDGLAAVTLRSAAGEQGDQSHQMVTTEILAVSDLTARVFADLSGLASGLYHLEVRSSRGDVVRHARTIEVIPVSPALPAHTFDHPAAVVRGAADQVTLVMTNPGPIDWSGMLDLQMPAEASWLVDDADGCAVTAFDRFAQASIAALAPGERRTLPIRVHLKGDAAATELSFVVSALVADDRADEADGAMAAANADAATAPEHSAPLRITLPVLAPSSGTWMIVPSPAHGLHAGSEARMRIGFTQADDIVAHVSSVRLESVLDPAFDRASFRPVAVTLGAHRIPLDGSRWRQTLLLVPAGSDLPGMELEGLRAPLEVSVSLDPASGRIMLRGRVISDGEGDPWRALARHERTVLGDVSLEFAAALRADLPEDAAVTIEASTWTDTAGVSTAEPQMMPVLPQEPVSPERLETRGEAEDDPAKRVSMVPPTSTDRRSIGLFAGWTWHGVWRHRLTEASRAHRPQPGRAMRPSPATSPAAAHALAAALFAWDHPHNNAPDPHPIVGPATTEDGVAH